MADPVTLQLTDAQTADFREMEREMAMVQTKQRVYLRAVLAGLPDVAQYAAYRADVDLTNSRVVLTPPAPPAIPPATPPATP